MQNGDGRLLEVYYEAGRPAGRIACRPGLVPSPGRYVLAAAQASSALPTVLAIPLFQAGPAQDGFLAASLPREWGAGTALSMRGPVGQGFALPGAAQRVVLAAWEGSAACLLPLVQPALAQGSGVVLVSDSPPPDLPHEVEVQPLKAMEEALVWADFAALDVQRDSLPSVRERLGRRKSIEGQVLVHTPMPCGALAECGACAVSFGRDWKLACKEGPVFGLKELLRV
jgi:hypothetical protein